MSGCGLDYGREVIADPENNQRDEVCQIMT